MRDSFKKALSKVKVLAFDADDTLWENEPLFREAERKACELLSEYGTVEELSAELYKTEAENMEELGYGYKPFIISMIETAVRVSGGKVSSNVIAEIINIGRQIGRNPAYPLDGVDEALKTLNNAGRYKMVVLTKGDLLDQKIKIFRSGLMKYFDDYIIVADKSDEAYNDIFKREGINADEFMMVGNSFKSDIAPVLRIGGAAVYVPFRITWEHEKTEEFDHPALSKISNIAELPSLLL